MTALPVRTDDRLTSLTEIDLWSASGNYHAAVACPRGITYRRILLALLKPALARPGLTIVFACDDTWDSLCQARQGLSIDPTSPGSGSLDPLRGLFPLDALDDWSLDFTAELIASGLHDAVGHDADPLSGSLLSQHLLSLAWRKAAPSLLDLQLQLSEYGGTGAAHPPLSGGEGNLWTEQSALTAAGYARILGKLISAGNAMPCFAPAPPILLPASGLIVFKLARLLLMPLKTVRFVMACLFLTATRMFDQAERVVRKAILLDHSPTSLGMLSPAAVESFLRKTRSLGGAVISAADSMEALQSNPSTNTALQNSGVHLLFAQRQRDIDGYLRTGLVPKRAAAQLAGAPAGDHIHVVSNQQPHCGRASWILNLAGRPSDEAPPVRLALRSSVH